MDKYLSIVMPFFNEEPTICQSLDMLLNAPLSIKKELILVNDGSTDNSANLAQNWIKKHESEIKIIYLSKPNGGKGSAVRAGIQVSSGDVLIIQDADCEYNPCDYQKCIDPILNGTASVVYGSRERYSLNRKTSSWGFYLGGLSVSLFFNLLYGTSLTDEPTCYKTFDGALIRSLDFKNDKFGWEPEVTAKILRLGLKIREVPIEYHPRKITEGKKIKLRDGVEALFLTALWRFKSIKNDRKKVMANTPAAPVVKAEYQFKFHLFMIFIIALLLRLALALPSLLTPENFLRPDSWSFLYFSDNFDFGSRAPLPVGVYYLFNHIFPDVNLSGAIFGIIVSSLTVFPVAYTAKVFGKNLAGIAAAAFWALNLTSIGNAPLILSDSLFGLLVGFEVFFLVRLWKKRRLIDFGYGIIFATLATLCRGMNLPFLLLVMPVLAIIFLRPVWKILLGITALAMVWGIFVAPFMYLNYQKKAGFNLEYNAGAGFIHNASAIIAHAEKRSSAVILKELQMQMAPYSILTIAEKNQLMLQKYLEIVKKYPKDFVITHLPQPGIMLPDLPAVSENLKLTREGRGTLAVIRQSGLYAGFKHYFNDSGNIILLMFGPFIVLTLMAYIMAFLEFFRQIRNRNYLFIIIFGALSLYYIVLPGPVIMPRYQLPALILIYAMSGVFLEHIISKTPRFQIK